LEEISLLPFLSLSLSPSLPCTSLPPFFLLGGEDKKYGLTQEEEEEERGE